MKFTSAVALLAGSAAALPAAVERRQFGLGGVGSTINELSNGNCRAITFIFARGSTEIGNIVSKTVHPIYPYIKLTDIIDQGSTVGPPTCEGLKDAYGANQVACQGVGSPYAASIGTNALPEGTNSQSYGEAQRLFDLAASKCPDTIIVAGGYSQGAAVMTASVRRLSDEVKAKIAGVVLYGNTRNAQTGGHIPDFPQEKSKTYCNISDGVCGGALVVTAGHLTYQVDVPDAVRYLQQRISAAGGGN